MNESDKQELSEQIIDELKQKNLLETEAISVLRGAISIVSDLKQSHKLN